MIEMFVISRQSYKSFFVGMVMVSNNLHIWGRFHEALRLTKVGLSD